MIAQNVTSYSKKMVMYNNWDQLTWQRQGRTALIELKANSCSVQQTAIVFQIFCANVLCKCSVQMFCANLPLYTAEFLFSAREAQHITSWFVSVVNYLKVEHIFTRSQEILTVRVSLREMWQSEAFGWSLVVGNVRDGISRASVSQSTVSHHLPILTEEDQTWYLF